MSTPPPPTEIAAADDDRCPSPQKKRKVPDKAAAATESDTDSIDGEYRYRDDIYDWYNSMVEDILKELCTKLRTDRNRRTTFEHFAAYKFCRSNHYITHFRHCVKYVKEIRQLPAADIKKLLPAYYRIFIASDITDRLLDIHNKRYADPDEDDDSECGDSGSDYDNDESGSSEEL